MYKISFLTIIILAVMVYGQKTTKNLVNEKSAGSYAIAGSDLLRDEDFKVAQFLKDNPDFFSKRKMMKALAWNFTVGSAKSWRAVDFTNNNTEYGVASTCRAVGTNCYIFVADDVWENTVDQNSVDAVADAFDNSTPVDPSKGIYQTDVESFGNLDGACLHDLRPQGSHFQHLVIRDVFDLFCFMFNARIGCIDPVDIGIYFACFGRKGFGQRHRR